MDCMHPVSDFEYKLPQFVGWEATLQRAKTSGTRACGDRCHQYGTNVGIFTLGGRPCTIKLVKIARKGC